MSKYKKLITYCCLVIYIIIYFVLSTKFVAEQVSHKKQ